MPAAPCQGLLKDALRSVPDHVDTDDRMAATLDQSVHEELWRRGRAALRAGAQPQKPELAPGPPLADLGEIVRVARAAKLVDTSP